MAQVKDFGEKNLQRQIDELKWSSLRLKRINIFFFKYV